MTDHRTDWVECPSCHIQMDGAYHANGEGGPEPGDPSICGYCAEILFYTHTPEGLALRSATSEEIVELLRDPTFVGVMHAVQAIIAKQ